MSHGAPSLKLAEGQLPKLDNQVTKCIRNNHVTCQLHCVSESCEVEPWPTVLMLCGFFGTRAPADPDFRSVMSVCGASSDCRMHDNVDHKTLEFPKPFTYEFPKLHRYGNSFFVTNGRSSILIALVVSDTVSSNDANRTMKITPLGDQIFASVFDTWHLRTVTTTSLFVMSNPAQYHGSGTSSCPFRNKLQLLC
eukprot:3693842-Amphidinium_carterae.1